MLSNLELQMGPPPDPEHMINMLQDPSFASTLDEALQNPALIEQMIQNNPMLRGMGPQVRQAMQNPAIRRMMTDPEMMRQATQMQRQMGGGMFGGGGAGEGAFPMPGATDTTPGQAGGERTGAATGNTAGTGAAPTNPFNPFAMFPNMGGAGQGEGAGAVGNPFAALFQPPSAPAGNSTNTASSPPPTGQEGTTANADTNQQAQQQQQQPANPFAAMAQNPMMQSMMQNPQLMQQMMQSMMGSPSPQQAGNTPSSDPSNPPSSPQQNPFAALFGPGGIGAGFGPGGGFGGGFGAAPAAAGPPDTRPPEERYEAQLRQLNDMGFYEFERNVEALRRSGGSVQGAIEYLLTH